MILLLTQLFSLNFSKVLPLLQRDKHIFLYFDVFFQKDTKTSLKLLSSSKAVLKCQ